MEAHQLRADADAVHGLVEAGEEGQGMEDDVGELFHAHARGRGRDDAPCLPNDRVHARPRDVSPVEGSWVCRGPLFPSPYLCLYPARAHDPCLQPQGRWQAPTKEQELQTMTRSRTSRGYVACCSHDHALFPFPAAAAAASSTSAVR